MGIKQLFISLGKFVFMWGFVQVILIGAAYFGAIDSTIHALAGLLMAIMALVMVILALVGRMGSTIIGLSVLMLLLLMPGQGFLIHMENLPNFVRALHPVFGIGVMFLGRSLAARAEKMA
jgi:hypothetical protein